MSDEYGDLDSIFAGQPQSRPQVTASVLRKQPVRQSSSLTQTVQPQTSKDPLQTQYERLNTEREGLLKEQDAAYAKPDYSGYQQEAQRRRGEGERSLMLALAAQEAGGMEPVAAHFLKRASAARDPMKVTGGTITDTGFVEDVGHSQELQARRLDARIKQIDTLQQQNLTTQEHTRLAQERMQHETELRQMMMQMQGAIAAQSSGDRRYAADLAHQDRQATVAAAGGKMTASDDKEITDVRKGIAAVDSAIKAVAAAPSAFGGAQGAVDYLPGVVGQVGMATRDRYLSDDELAARAMVYNNVSAVIKERAGTAQTGQEMKRLNSFLPAPTDTDKQINAKMNAFREYLIEQGNAVSSKYPNARHNVNDLQQPQMPNAANVQRPPVQQRAQSYLQE